MNTQGIGLGLVISENIVKAFSGNIGLRSVFGKGTHFTFSFLLGKDDINENKIVAENNKKQITVTNTSNTLPHQISSFATNQEINSALKDKSSSLPETNQINKDINHHEAPVQRRSA